MSIQIALTLECIWNFKNSIVHSGPHSNLPIILKGLELRVADHLALVEGVDRVSNNVLICQKAPPPDYVKLNTDVVVKPNSTSVAVVARDANGSVLKAWARYVDMNDPVIAEAFAMKLALELAKEESFINIIVESDSKIYINFLEVNSAACCWKIDPLASDVNSLATCFLFCCFSWIKREANTVA